MAAKPKTFVIIVVLAIAVAAFASFSLYKYLKGQEARVKEAVATGKVAVASREISVGSSIRSDQVRLTDWPRASMPQGSFSSDLQDTLWTQGNYGGGGPGGRRCRICNPGQQSRRCPHGESRVRSFRQQDRTSGYPCSRDRSDS
jgi:hypothetical protein